MSVTDLDHRPKTSTLAIRIPHPYEGQALILRVFRNKIIAWEVYTTVSSDRSAYQKGNIFTASRQTDAVWWTID